jgi:hypothetical protein
VYHPQRDADNKADAYNSDSLWAVLLCFSGEAHDWCTTGKCSATRLTVEGYSIVKGDATSTAYVLNCVEVIVNDPTPHIPYQCVRLHANRNYDAKLLADSICLSPRPRLHRWPLTTSCPKKKSAGNRRISLRKVPRPAHYLRNQRGLFNVAFGLANVLLSA